MNDLRRAEGDYHEVAARIYFFRLRATDNDASSSSSRIRADRAANLYSNYLDGTHLEVVVRAEGEYGESVDNVLLEGWFLLVSGREGRLLAVPRGSGRPGRPRVAVARMTGLGTESEAEPAAAADADAAGGVLVLAAMTVLLVVRRSLP